MGWHDRNWLNIRIAVTHPRGSWERSAPALLTEEVAKLASWFEQVARGEARGDCRFVEPKLVFALATDAAGREVVRVYIEQRLRPMWAEAHESGTRDLWVDFPIDAAAFLAAALDLRRQLAIFPERSGDDSER